MNIEAFREYCLSKKGVTESFPFDESTLVFKVMGKMFALTGLNSIPLTANLKCDPEAAIQLREEYDGLIYPGYHMSKIHWNSVVIESLPTPLIQKLTDDSYDLVVKGLPNKDKEALKTLGL